LTRLRPAVPADLGDCISFLLPREFRCVSLSSRLARGNRPSLPDPSEGTLWVLRDEGLGSGALPGPDQIKALFFVTPASLIYHCVREGFNLLEASRILARNLVNPGVACVVGTRAGTDAFENIASAPPRIAVDYDLLTLEREDFTPRRKPELPGNLPRGGFGVFQAKQEDLDLIYPLQAGYEREEVLLPGEAFVPGRCRSLLRLTLASQRVIAAQRDSLAVAKANTNAQGFGWDQIGGEYTLPHYRGNGFGAAVFEALCAQSVSKGKNLALFVKTGNISAKNLYFRTGFRLCEGFRIAYW